MSPVRISEKEDQLNKLEMIISSPIRLIVGGSAKLDKLAISHHVVISGSIICNPRVIMSVRVWVRS